MDLVAECSRWRVSDDFSLNFEEEEDPPTLSATSLARTGMCWLFRGEAVVYDIQEQHGLFILEQKKRGKIQESEFYL